VLDQRVGDGQDVRRRAVVLLHEEHLRVGIVAFEVEEVLDRRAAPRVHALVRVADHAHVAVLRGELVDQLVLSAVRVLVLVDQDVAEPLLVVLEHLGPLPEQQDGLGDEVVEVERSGRALALLVGEVHLRDGLLVEVAGEVVEVVCRENLVLRLADRGRHRPGRVALRVEIEIPKDRGEEALRVALVVDREAPRQAEVIVLGTQDPGAGRVEGQDPHPTRDALADQALDALGHLAGRLVRERDGQDGVRVHAPLADQERDPVRERARLPRACTGDDQDRALTVKDGLNLNGVQVLEERRGGRHRFNPRHAHRHPRWNPGDLRHSSSDGPDADARARGCHRAHAPAPAALR
jgi:hypothetical protein